MYPVERGPRGFVRYTQQHWLGYKGSLANTICNDLGKITLILTFGATRGRSTVKTYDIALCE